MDAPTYLNDITKGSINYLSLLSKQEAKEADQKRMAVAFLKASNWEIDCPEWTLKQLLHCRLIKIIQKNSMPSQLKVYLKILKRVLAGEDLKLKEKKEKYFPGLDRYSALSQQLSYIANLGKLNDMIDKPVAEILSIEEQPLHPLSRQEVQKLAELHLDSFTIYQEFFDSIFSQITEFCERILLNQNTLLDQISKKSKKKKNNSNLKSCLDDQKIKNQILSEQAFQFIRKVSALTKIYQAKDRQIHKGLTKLATEGQELNQMDVLLINQVAQQWRQYYHILIDQLAILSSLLDSMKGNLYIPNSTLAEEDKKYKSSVFKTLQDKPQTEDKKAEVRIAERDHDIESLTKKIELKTVQLAGQMVELQECFQQLSALIQKGVKTMHENDVLKQKITDQVKQAVPPEIFELIDASRRANHSYYNDLQYNVTVCQHIAETILSHYTQDLEHLAKKASILVKEKQPLDFFLNINDYTEIDRPKRSRPARSHPVQQEEVEKEIEEKDNSCFSVQEDFSLLPELISSPSISMSEEIDQVIAKFQAESFSDFSLLSHLGSLEGQLIEGIALNYPEKSLKLDPYVKARFKTSRKEAADQAFLAGSHVELILKEISQGNLVAVSAALPSLLIHWSVLAEQLAIPTYIMQNKTLPPNHSLVQLYQTTNLWHTLDQELQDYIQDIDFGLIWGRYPHICANSLFKSKILDWILFWEKTSAQAFSHEGLIADAELIEKTKAFSDYLIDQHQLSHKLVNHFAKQTQSSELIQTKETSSENSFNGLKEKMQDVLSQLSMGTYSFVSSPLFDLQKRCNSLIDILNQAQPHQLPSGNPLSALKEVQGHVRRMLILSTLASRHPEAHLQPCFAKVTLNMQWAFEQLYQARCLLHKVIGLETAHSFEIYQDLLEQAWLLESKEKISYVSHPDRIRRFNFGFGVHYPRLKEKLYKSKAPAIRQLTTLIDKGKASLQRDCQIDRAQNYFEALLISASEELRLLLQDFEQDLHIVLSS